MESLNSRLESDKEEEEWTRRLLDGDGELEGVFFVNERAVRRERRVLAHVFEVCFLKGGKGLFITSQSRSLHANEGNQMTRKGTSP